MSIWNLLFSTYGILYMLNSILIFMMLSATGEASRLHLPLRPGARVLSKFAGLGILVQIVSAIIASFQYEWWSCFVLMFAGIIVATIVVSLFYKSIRDRIGRKALDTNTFVLLDESSYGREWIILINHLAMIVVSTLLFIFQFV